MGKKFKSIDQVILNYYAAKGIKAVIDENNNQNKSQIEKDITYIVRRLLAPQVGDRQLLELYSEIVDFTEVNVLPALLASCSLEAMEKYRFKDAPSVTTVEDDNRHLSSTVSNYKELSKVTLYDHTIHVVRNILNNYSKEHTVTKINIVLCGLLHDFGKQSTIRNISKEKNIPVTFHASVSGFFVKDLLYSSASEKASEIFPEDSQPVIFKSLPKKIAEVAKLVENHHDASKNTKGILAKMKEADTLARIEEMKQIEKEGKNEKK